MTAYVNDEQKKEGAYGKAVKATLAATLAAGMVPAAAAFADEPAEAAAASDDPSIDLLVADNGFADAKVVAAYDNAGNEVKDADGKNGFDLTFNGASNYVKSLKLQLADGNETEVTVQNDNTYKFTYKKDGQPVQPNTVQQIGNYTLEIEYVGEGSYKGQKITVNFEIKAQQSEKTIALGMVGAVEAGKAAAVDSNIVFNGLTGDDLLATGTKDELGELALTVNGEITAIDSAKVYKTSNTAAGAEIDAANEVLYAGDYIAVVTYDTDKTATVLLTVKPFDLASATVTADAVDAAPTTAPSYSIAGVNEALKAQLVASYDLAKNDNVPQGAIKDLGEYTFTLAVKDAQNKELAASVTGTKDFDVQYVKAIADIQYKGQAWVENLGAFTAGTTAFDVDDVTFGTADEKYCSVKVFDAAGKEVSDWSAPGKYTVVAEVNDPTFATGGSKTGSFTVSYGQVATDGIYVQYDGQLTDKIEKTYDGEDLVKGVSVKVVNGKKTMTEGVDYKLVYTDANGKEVTEIVDAGDYTLTVKPVTFSFDNQKNTVSIKVTPIALNDVRVANRITITDKEGNKATGLPYTGSAITPGFEYKTGDKDAEGKDIYAKVPADIYTAAYKFDGKYVEEVLEAGEYTAELTLNANVKNYSLPSNTCTFKVIKKQSFLDVPADAWFAEAVSTAFEKNWIKGYANGDFFGPYDSITRADVCVVVARMAGVDLAIDSENWGSETSFYETPFSDVDGHMYYAQAIAWAADAGIVKGDGNTGSFRPNDEVSRSEFAAIMMRYAQKAGDDTVVEDGALDGYADADQVPAWFENEVAWAVEAGIMGVGTDVINPNGEITRAEVAAMAIRL